MHLSNVMFGSPTPEGEFVKSTHTLYHRSSQETASKVEIRGKPETNAVPQEKQSEENGFKNKRQR
jgi:hypothetical protein